MESSYAKGSHKRTRRHATPEPDPNATSRKEQSRESHMAEREWHRARLPADAAGVKPYGQPVTGTIRTYL